jgi:cobaltochelatase CobN
MSPNRKTSALPGAHCVKHLLKLVALATLLPALLTAAAPVKVSLLTGDAHSAAALGAITELRRDPALREVTVRAFSRLGVTDLDRRFVRESDIIIGYPRDTSLLRSLDEEIRAAAQRGSLVASVGNVLESGFSELGFKRDPALTAYFEGGGQANLLQMLRAALARQHRPELKFSPPTTMPKIGFFDVASGRAFESFEDYASTYQNRNPEHRDRSWIGVYFSRDTATSGQTELLSAIGAALKRRGFNALFAYGYPPDVAVPKLFMDADGQSRVEAIAAITMKIGNVPDKLVPLLSQLDVPVFNAIALNSQSRAEWEASASGLDILERSWQVGSAELGGAIAPTIVASKEKLVDVATGLAYVSIMPIPERVERLAERVQASVRLRHESPAQKRVAIIYYNYPPGKGNIGASYLNVLPNSLAQILNRLRTEGYNADGAPQTEDELSTAIRTYASNPEPTPGVNAAIDELARSGRVPLLPLGSYRAWFEQLPPGFRRQILDKWGEPEESDVMIWRDAEGRAFVVIPALRWGNLLFAPQPTRGWEQDLDDDAHHHGHSHDAPERKRKMTVCRYHDVTLPPHHQYLAFYLWLQKSFDAHAMIHVGTHASHEWLPGKEVGFTAADTGEILVGAVPQFYPFIMDDVGEGLQAKRRAMAAMISHLTPPLDRASLNPELREIMSIISDYQLARDKGSLARDDLRRNLAAKCEKIGLFKDLAISPSPDGLLTDEQVEEIEHHAKKIGEKLTPFGMHTFGVAPTEALRAATAEAILSLEPGLSADEHARRKADLMSRIEASARAELDALAAGLAGRYIAAGPGSDPVRNPDALPTGRNFYGFDPSRMPTPAIYAAGVRLASEFIESYRRRHSGNHPDRLVFNLWGTETSRHEGVMEAQILALMGVRPSWDARGRVQGVELITRSELGRPRVDVTIVPSGLYRDLFASLMLLLDEAVNVVKTDRSADNPLLQNIATTRAALETRGVAPAEAEQLAAVRLFSVPSGAYGTGLDHVIQQADGWTNDQQVAEVFFNRMSHLFGQGFWGARPSRDGQDPGLAQQVLRLAFKNTKGVIHSRSSNLYGAIDSDDFYQYLGGTALAVRHANDRAAEVFITDLSNPRAGETVTLERFMGRELRARYLNPKWIEAMLKEGYAGARVFQQVTDHLWGWQVTVPEAVDAAKWQEMYETYVQDRYQLNIREKLRAAENLEAYKAIIDRLLTVIEKGYWNAAPETVASLREAQSDLAPAVVAEHQSVAQRADAYLGPAPSLTPSAVPTPAQATRTIPPSGLQEVRGRVLEEQVSKDSHSIVAAVIWSPRLVVMGIIALILIVAGWWRQGRDEFNV